MSQDGTAVVRRFIEEVINRGNLDVVDEIFDPGFVDRFPHLGHPASREGMKQGIPAFREAMPDLHASIEELFSVGELVAARISASGTQTGTLMGLPPSGKRITWPVMVIVRIVDGRAVERWMLHDDFTMMQQLGLIPTFLSRPDRSKKSLWMLLSWVLLRISVWASRQLDRH